jgi:ATP-dependent exoDNAse (exonuclease V) alpha subunit
VYRDAAALLRDHQAAAAVEVLRAQGAVSDHHARPIDAWVAMVDDWFTHRDHGDQVLMLATERATVAELNGLARAHLVARGAIARRSRTYRAPNDSRTITLAVGDEVIVRRNRELAQPDGRTVAVRNGMTGRVTVTRRREITVGLDTAHRTPEGPVRVTLPAGYVGAHVDYGYARTVDTAQGATVDHSLLAPSPSATAERAYVALSRGRRSNRIYATHDRAWIDAIGRDRGHALAVDQTLDINRKLQQVMRLRSPARDREPPLEIGL